MACWRAEAAWVLTIRDCKDLAWALTQEWALSIHAAKTSTWALTWEWALAWDTMVLQYGTGSTIAIIEFAIWPGLTSTQLLNHAIKTRPTVFDLADKLFSFTILV